MTETPDAMIDRTHPGDLVVRAVRTMRAPVCVGLDPVLDRLPSANATTRDAETAAGLLADFSLGVLDAVQGHVPCVKIQAACYERYGPPGAAALEAVLHAARERTLVTILDAKRGDIGISARHYAAAAFESAAPADWITVNGYLGMDGVAPFVAGGGAFVLVRTSNPGGDAFQTLPLTDGRSIADAMADLVADAGRESVGQEGFSAIGAVVGATKPEDAQRLRERMPQQIFLVPGYGAQGGTVHDVLPCFCDGGLGALVTASRSVVYAFEHKDGPWTAAVADAAARLADDIGAATGMR